MTKRKWITGHQLFCKVIYRITKTWIDAACFFLCSVMTVDFVSVPKIFWSTVKYPKWRTYTRMSVHFQTLYNLLTFDDFAAYLWVLRGWYCLACVRRDIQISFCSPNASMTFIKLWPWPFEYRNFFWVYHIYMFSLSLAYVKSKWRSINLSVE